MNLGELDKDKGITRGKKRRGRGIGSGKGGHTTGTGHKGQKSRKGRKPALGFEGGQVPLFKRLPQIKGFSKPIVSKAIAVGINKLNVFNDGTEVTPTKLREKGIITKLSNAGVKLLGNGALTKKLKLKGFTFSKGAEEGVAKSGSEIIG